LILVIAPHADDEAIGCGGFIRRQSERGHQVEVILLASPREGDIRITEYQHSLNCLGVSDSICFGYIEQSIELTPNAVVRLLTLIESRRPKLILCPHHEEQDVDHKRAAAMVHAVMKIVSFRQACLHNLITNEALAGVILCQLCSKSCLIVPRQPSLGIFEHVLRVLLQCHEVIERIYLGQLASVNQTHKDVAHLCTA
jgi:hypothetical protein